MLPEAAATDMRERGTFSSHTHKKALFFGHMPHMSEKLLEHLLTPVKGLHIVIRQYRTPNPLIMAESQYAQLESKLNQLIELCQRLDKENAALKAREATWQQEKLRLVEKNELARSRVEAMIKRLKSLESEG